MITRLVLSCLALAVSVTAAGTSADAPTGLQHDVAFAAFPAYAKNGELLRRLVSPLNAARIERGLAGNPAALQALPLDPSQQRFALYVPPGPPPAGGYALLVFVPPWDDARVPPQWIPALDRHHVIFVSAAHSGNDADVLNRREPLALLAAYGVMQRYRVDPARVYVGGFSGGSRIALRLALGYPDVFRGALLDAGSDPIGNAQIPLPPAELFHRFQQSTRIVFLTGEDDNIRQAQMAHARESLHDWCVFDVDSVTMRSVSHDLADAQGFGQALDDLAEPAALDRAALADCRAGIEARMKAQLLAVRRLLDSHRNGDAQTLLRNIDAQYGGLAAPQTTALMDSTGAH